MIHRRIQPSFDCVVRQYHDHALALLIGGPLGVAAVVLAHQLIIQNDIQKWANDKAAGSPYTAGQLIDAYNFAFTKGVQPKTQTSTGDLSSAYDWIVNDLSATAKANGGADVTDKIYMGWATANAPSVAGGITSAILANQALTKVGGQVGAALGVNGGTKIADVGLEIPPGKFDYLFGRSVSNEDNAAGSNQLALEIKRLGVPDTLSGQQMLSEHLTQSVKAEGNVVNTFSNQYGTFEVRESLFMGPSGKAANLQSTFQILPDGTRRLSTVIPRH